MLRIRRITWLLLPFIPAICADQITKSLARQMLAGIPAFSVLLDCVRFQYIENHGGFLGYLNPLPESVRFWLLSAGVAVVLVAAGAYMFASRSYSSRQCASASLILAGGTSNLIDRLINNGGVIDFISIGIGPVRTGIFNLADLFILAGAFYIGFSVAVRNEREPASSQSSGHC
jgi:signal peptidase II